MNNKNILVTGGAGYIGSHICKELKLAGYNPVTYDNLITGNKHAIKWGEFVEGCILDKNKLIKTIKEHNIFSVIHVAAFISVNESVSDPGKYYNNNTLGGLTILEAMKETSVKNIVFSSTAAVYGAPTTIPITEDIEKKPINPYGRSKYMVEQILEDYETAFDIKHVTLRYFNVAGADVDGEIGCEHKEPGNLIPIIMNVMSGKQDILKIFGTDYDTQDGTAVRDYIHVTDLAKAHIKSLEYLYDEGNSDVFNLGNGKGYSVKEVVDSASKVAGKEINYKLSDRRVGDPAILYADATKAKNILKWQPELKDIDVITKSAWDWQKNGNKI